MSYKDEITFPVCLKNEGKNGQPTLYWRYASDGKVEQISYDAFFRVSSFCYQDLYKDYSALSKDRAYLIRQLELFTKIEEEEFIEQMKFFYEQHERFLDPDHVPHIIPQEEKDKFVNFDGIIRSRPGEQAPF